MNECRPTHCSRLNEDVPQNPGMSQLVVRKTMLFGFPEVDQVDNVPNCLLKSLELDYRVRRTNRGKIV